MNQNKLWAGRSKKELNARVNDFNSSISFDYRMYREDIQGSIAHAKMLGKCDIIQQSDAEKIVDGLHDILADIESGTLEFDMNAEDIHMFIETILTERIGEAGKRLHTARSRNDQVALDIRMYLKNQIKLIINEIIELLSVIYELAKMNKYTVMAGYTHLQRAQPVTFSHYILAYSQMFKRDIERLSDVYKRTDVMPLGSGALAATTYLIDREYVCELLGFAKVTENSIDAVSDRDFVIELTAALSILMTHMSRFSEEIILWCSSEFGFIELDDAFSTGSSIMPQKKNPDIAELVRGKAGRVNGDLVTLLTVMKGLPLAYNKDMQEDKEAVFDAIDNVKISLEVFAKMLETIKVNVDVLQTSAAKGFINATDCADYLVKRGIPFRDAYKIVGTLVAYCIDNDKTLDSLTIEEYKEIDNVFESDIYQSIDLRNCVNNRKVIGGPSEESVNRQLDALNNFINEVRKNEI